VRQCDNGDLVGSGVPIEGEAGIGYLMRAGYDLPPLMFSRDEIVALVAGARLIRAWGGAAMAQVADASCVLLVFGFGERSGRLSAGASSGRTFVCFD